MSALTILNHPPLQNPILVSAFLGWNDAGESATGAVRQLRRLVGAQRIAEIDPEEFFVFTTHRPTVRLAAGMQREIRWPATCFAHGRLQDGPHDLVLGVGTEPDLKWKTFCKLMVDLGRSLEVREAVTLGALLADTPHTRPVPITGSVSDPDRAVALGFQPSRYEGPTGIVGALTDAYRQAGIPTVSLWASVPHYVSGGYNPRASEALLRRLSDIYHLNLDLHDLGECSHRFEAEISEALKEHPDVQEYITRLENDIDSGATAQPRRASSSQADLRSSDVLAEVDRLLRGRAGNDPTPDADA